MTDLVISNLSFFLNDFGVKIIPKAGNLSESYKKGSKCRVYIDTTCHACVEPKETSCYLSTLHITHCDVVRFSEIDTFFNKEMSEDFKIDLRHQNPSISDSDDITIIYLSRI